MHSPVKTNNNRLPRFAAGSAGASPIKKAHLLGPPAGSWCRAKSVMRPRSGAAPGGDSRSWSELLAPLHERLEFLMTQWTFYPVGDARYQSPESLMPLETSYG